MGRLSGKVAVVTGASSGMGSEIVKLYASEGANVVAVARRQNRLEELAASLKDAEGKVEIFPGDISDKAVNEARGERGTLIASGFIAGGALMGVVSALMRFGGLNFVSEEWLANPLSELAALAAYILLICYFIRATKTSKKA